MNWTCGFREEGGVSGGNCIRIGAVQVHAMSISLFRKKQRDSIKLEMDKCGRQGDKVTEL